METTHPLAAWIEKRGMSDTEFARQVGCSKSHLSLILRGRKGLSLDLATRIEEITGGEFTAGRLMREHKAMREAAVQ